MRGINRVALKIATGLIAPQGGTVAQRLNTLLGANLLVSFDMSEGSGSTLVNKGASGTAQNATIAGGVTWVAGIGNLAYGLDFDGLTGFFSFTLPTMTEDHTIITLSYADTHGEAGNGFLWFFNGDYLLRQLGTNARLSLEADYTTTDAGTIGANNTTNLTTNLLNFYSLASADKTLRLRQSINGGAVAEASYTSQTAGTGTYVTPSGTFYGFNNNIATGTFDGRAYYFGIVNRLVTASERTQILNILLG